MIQPSSKIQNPNSKIIWVVLVASLSLGGCSVEKARALQGAAVQFKTESLAAIDAIDQMRQRELEAPPRSQADIRQGFISRVLNSKVDLNSAVIDLAIDPFQPPKVAEWDDFIVDLRSQYEGFASIFDKLNSGAIVSQAEAKQSAEYARRLTVQMALLADAINKNPPMLGQYRSRTIVKLKKLRQDYQTLLTRLKSGSDGSETLQQMNQRKSDLENQAGELMNEWQQIKQEEQKLLETTVVQCTKAATMGKELVEVANHYNDLEVGQLNALIPRILTTAAAFTGRDYSVVKVKATNLVSQIQSDPFWSGVTKTLLDRANTAAASRTQVQVNLPVSLPPTSRNR
ncbi:hypothetical protein C7B65_02240 [Phormidesmis priestleyi ULC007]|uniref:Lipoprotein n=1 Tax=Phormidesmis priestleyi ULC007 TaxID=1920490 RepID=A0A2T1DP55_9CYAN|nr:hypothetical protein [Phormidesmis priestleyi]PSB22242.1 hypothetical protein C7B65_02240 [Phormidesmis priestleyi ULC007]PZO52497.1 MAG: hypothetical protein DCF14_05945 [Phormidesmis priestleyi]